MIQQNYENYRSFTICQSENKDFFVACGTPILLSPSSKWRSLISFTLCPTLLSKLISLYKFHTRCSVSLSQSGCEVEKRYFCTYRKYIAMNWELDWSIYRWLNQRKTEVTFQQNWWCGKRNIITTNISQWKNSWVCIIYLLFLQISSWDAF
jgi:hypothetical protein